MQMKHPDYLTREYTLLFNAITDTIQTLHTLSVDLAALQQQAEENYINKQSE